MSATCNGCGDCCERIWLSGTLTAAEWREWFAFIRRPAAETGSADRWYLLAGIATAGRPWWLDDPSARFIAQHWQVVDPVGPYHSCDAFDPVSRRCTVHGTPEKPPVCLGFPWYDRAPCALTLVRYPRCSYWADVHGRLFPRFSV